MDFWSYLVWLFLQQFCLAELASKWNKRTSEQGTDIFKTGFNVRLFESCLGSKISGLIFKYAGHPWNPNGAWWQKHWGCLAYL